MPHGALFRGGDEGRIRTGFLNDDVIEAVIGLGPQLFYGTGIPACILVLRPVGSKPAARRGRVLFINADRDYREGRAQNYMEPAAGSARWKPVSKQAPAGTSGSMRPTSLIAATARGLCSGASSLTFVEPGQHVVVDDGRAVVVWSAVHDAVADRADPASLG